MDRKPKLNFQLSISGKKKKENRNRNRKKLNGSILMETLGTRDGVKREGQE